ncbi:hypothetical protein CSUI_009348, partial [Cystoisospora suis]
VGLAIEVCRGTACISSMEKCLSTAEESSFLFIHTAPAEGLSLL